MTPPAAPPSPLLLRRATPADAGAIVRIHGDPLVVPQLLQLPYPSVEAMRARLAEQDAPGRADLQLVAERDGEVLGSAGLHAASAPSRRRHAAMLGIAVLPRAQGQGVGSALMQALVDYADRWGSWLRLELTVYTDNLGAIRLYERFGFRHEGTHRAFALRDGRFAAVHTMARLHPDPPTVAWPP